MSNIVPTPEEITLAGVTLTMKALTDRQHMALDQWVRSQMIKAAAESVPADDPLWDRIVAAATRESLAVTWHNSRLTGKARYARLFWESCKATPGLTEDKVMDLLQGSSLAEFKAANAAYMRLNYPNSEAKPEKEDPPNPPAA